MYHASSTDYDIITNSRIRQDDAFRTDKHVVANRYFADFGVANGLLGTAVMA